MKRICILSLLALALVFSSGCNKKVPGSGEVELENMSDSISYALGFVEAQQFKTIVYQTAFDSIDVEKAASLFSDLGLQEGYLEFRTNQFGELNEDVFRTAFINELAYGYSYFDNATADEYLQAMFSLFREKKEAENKEASVKRSSEANDFLVENAQRDEIVVTESGLQYEILTQGDGAIPTATDQIECHYHGTLIDGTVFDSSVERGESITFAVGQVIPGWTEALQMMPVGSKWKLYIPSHLAYGEGGAGDAIGPNETLIFEVELLDIVD